MVDLVNDLELALMNARKGGLSFDSDSLVDVLASSRLTLLSSSGRTDVELHSESAGHEDAAPAFEITPSGVAQLVVARTTGREDEVGDRIPKGRSRALH